MSTLGLSGPPESTDGLWKGLFWPKIQNAEDANLAATRGFWVCLALAFVSAPMGTSGASLTVGVNLASSLDLAVFAFYLLGATGVRQSSIVASAAMVAAYLISSCLYFWLAPTHFSFFRLIGIALLLATLRAARSIRVWRRDPNRQEEVNDAEERSNSTWTDGIADQLSQYLWPYGRFVFYVLAALLLPLECIELGTLLTHHT